MWSTHILKVFSSTSAITGFSPNKATTSAVATYVKDGQMTSSPGFKLQDIKAICNASVPFAHGITCLHPKYLERLDENSCTFGPLIYFVDEIVSELLYRFGSLFLSIDFWGQPFVYYSFTVKN